MYIKMITKLIEDGYAYQSGGNVYFDTTKFKNYYELPKVVLEIMNWLCTTRFYENTFLSGYRCREYFA